MRTVLLLDPDAETTAARLRAAIESAGGEARPAAGAAEAEHLVSVGGCEVLVFDTALLDDELLRRFRRRHPDRALVAWLDTSSSARAADLLEGGADEVLDGTMSDRELRARLLAARNGSGRSATAVQAGPLRVDAAHGDASWDGRELLLSRREREVLHVLAEAAGRTVRRDVLYRQVWGYTMARGDRSVDVNVKRLRDKLAAAGTAVQIATQPGIGYRLEVVEREAAVTGL